MINGLIRSMFQGYKEAKPKHGDWEYEMLEESPFLYSSQYLGDLYTNAKTIRQKEAVAAHIAFHHAYDVPSYKVIEQKFIDERWSK